ncbi:DUF167 domain-containing protein [Rubrobacter naiadicus]|uniref:DUF167 domain-containing protein n=1 Tax=Rubrobacter naiadicus TaxID=1392641 RepID=UPI00236229EB|nr:DUF167 domain-containing protein [Rubrobacter naiadicus]
MDEGFLLEAGDGGTLLRVHVSPGSGRSRIAGSYGGNALKVRVGAPPTQGRANAELRRFVAGLLGMKPSDVELVRGSSAREKVLFLKGVEPEGVAGAFDEYLRGG